MSIHEKATARTSGHGGHHLDRKVVERLAANRRATSRKSAAELDAETGYKAVGMTVKELRAVIAEERRRQDGVRSRRKRARELDPTRALHLRSAGHYLSLQIEARRWCQDVRVVPLSEAQRSPDARNVVQVGRRYVRGNSDVRYDRERYSRAWHKSYGPARAVTNRRAELVALTPHGYRAVAALPLDSFRGQWLERAMAELVGSYALSVARLTDPDQAVRERGVLRLGEGR